MSFPEITSPKRIGELARITGKTVRTIHFYEEKGLLRPMDRTKGGFRLYGRDAVARIHWIERLKELGFALGEIRDFLDKLRDQESAPATMASLGDFYEEKLRETREAIGKLRSLERELEESLAYLQACKGCAPEMDLTTCRCCDGNMRHLGEPPPPMVAAIHDPIPSPDGSEEAG